MLSTPTRRELLHAAVTAIAIARPPRLGAATYDLLIKGGRVIDPAQRLDAVADVGIVGTVIAAVGPDLPAAEAAKVIDASGRIVTPGLVDIHAHISQEMPPSHCLSTGVTALADAGSAYAGVVGAIGELLPPLSDDQWADVRAMAKDGPPSEDVGLQPFAPPEYMPDAPAPRAPCRAERSVA